MQPIVSVARRGAYVCSLQTNTRPSSAPPPLIAILLVADLRVALQSRPRGIAETALRRSTPIVSGSLGRSPSPQCCQIDPQAPKLPLAARSPSVSEARSSPPCRRGFLPPLFGDVDDEFPPGNPFHHPDRETCIVPFSPAMRDKERCLERTLIICVGGTRPEVSVQEVAWAFQAERGLLLDSFSVYPYFLENFLVIFDSHSSKDQML